MTELTRSDIEEGVSSYPKFLQLLPSIGNIECPDDRRLVRQHFDRYREELRRNLLEDEAGSVVPALTEAAGSGPSYLAGQIRFFIAEVFPEYAKRFPLEDCNGNTLVSQLGASVSGLPVAKEFFKTHRRWYRETIEDTTFRSRYGIAMEEAWGGLVAGAYAQCFQNEFRWLQRSMKKWETSYTVEGLLRGAAGAACDINSDRAKRITDIQLGLLGLDTDTFVNSWENNGHPDRMGRYFSNNLKEMAYVERIVEKGAAKTLHELFVLFNFARYKDEILQHMYEERENSDERFGVHVNALHDRGAFRESTYVRSRIRESVTRKTFDGKRALYRATEVDSVESFLERLKLFRDRYNCKISFLIIGIHGSGTGGKFGCDDSSSGTPGITREMVDDGVLDELNDLLTPLAPILLNSCLTGQVGGLAQSISGRVRGRTVTAPELATRIEDLHFTPVSTMDHEVGLAVNFKEGRKMQYVDGVLTHC